MQSIITAALSLRVPYITAAYPAITVALPTIAMSHAIDSGTTHSAVVICRVT